VNKDSLGQMIQQSGGRVKQERDRAEGQATAFGVLLLTGLLDRPISRVIGRVFN
jgi:hypothetical protein